MRTRRGFIGTVSLLAITGCQSEDTDPDMGNGGDGPSLSSLAFVPGTTLSVQYTCGGEDVSPPLEIRATPGGVESMAVVINDPGEPHTEQFRVRLLDTTLELKAGRDSEPFQSTADPHVRGEATITVKYARR